MIIKRREKGERKEIVPTALENGKKEVKRNERECIPFYYRSLFFDPKK